VALSTRGKPWGNTGPWKVFQSILQRLKLAHERLHALRAFFVTVLLNGHMPVHVVRELAGHEDLGTTQGYAAILAPLRGAAVDVLDQGYQEARAKPAVEGAGQRTRRSRRSRSMRRVGRVTRRIRELRSRALKRARRRGNNPETGPIAA
jgi:hypothetical protein